MARHYPHGNLVVPFAQAKTSANPGTEFLKDDAQEDAKTHYAVPGKLFPRLPSLADVVQGGIGNCGLMATILAILNTDNDWGVEYIQGMMADKTFTVIVRLFDDSGAAKFVRVKKSIPKESPFGASAVSRGALWVQMLEKAIAADSTGKYGAGMSPESMFKKLLGNTQVPPERREVLRSRLFTHLMDVCRPSGSEANLQELAKQQDRHKQPWSPGNVEQYILILGTREKLDVWTAWITENLNSDERNYKKYRRKQNIHVFTEEDFQKWFPIAASDLDKEVYDAVWDWVTDGGVLPGSLFSGRYGKEQVEMYKTIKKALKDGRPVTAATPDKFPAGLIQGKAMSKDGSAGEQSLDGIYAKHHYAVVKTSKDEHLRFVHVRNPHGETGRTYDQRQPKRWDGPESKLELTDFTRTFSEFTIGGGAKTTIG